MKIANYQKNIESTEYNACSYEIDGIKIIERTAKITPKKIGQFVTCWKRNANGITEPHKDTDDFDFFFIKVKSKEKSGVFKFPKDVLIKHGILSTKKKTEKEGLESIRARTN
jgi:hypothetical protein